MPLKDQPFYSGKEVAAYLKTTPKTLILKAKAIQYKLSGFAGERRREYTRKDIEILEEFWLRIKIYKKPQLTIVNPPLDNSIFL